MEGVSNLIVCDKCSQEFEAKSIEFKTVETVIENKKFEIVFYSCPNCKEVYIICMLDYWGKKLQQKYIAALDGYRLAHHKQSAKTILEQKLEKAKSLKEEAMMYQNKLLHKYESLIPEEILV